MGFCTVQIVCIFVVVTSAIAKIHVHLTERTPEECTVDNSIKVECGNNVTTASDCWELDCCWHQSSDTEVPSCFEPKAAPTIQEQMNPQPIIRRNVADSCGNPLNTLSQAHKDETVSFHNHLRAQEYAADMRFLRWNEKLANLAQKLADRCLFEHENLGYCGTNTVGQNLFLRTISNTSEFSQTSRDNVIRDAIQAFYNEFAYYNLTANTCKTGKMCGHYKQVVWSTSYEVGCAVNYCNSWHDYKGTYNSKGQLLVCNYIISGNYGGYPPYFSGEPCSYCKLAVKTEKAICVNNSFCEPCDSTDWNPNCKYASVPCRNGGTFNYDTGACDCAPGFFGDRCTHVISADVCKNGGTFDVQSNTCKCTSAACGDVCDQSNKAAASNCHYFKSSGFCANGHMYRPYMLANCICSCKAS